ncbi:vWA domain-containing protein [Rhizobium leguminosarum]|uniref:vWA domain-containing protein n=1 Tax=Rhizobium leguminosarum TaxID=384 RepID=UPI0013C1A1C0|nr:VWA domain-containing protein [Rhizobium leguminosarum]NEH97719.1 VWA domain-containing protein [Rhizobium leguminosarum]NEJ44458.1 VWA domain-containing protein [Rhizobium leguminosarum]NEJ54145.1 VWA domain-containing protein [Rhizobium leguminosarum]NEJ82715.1 VWA domain-containing protein [Rhizobium leguminosarum]
MTAVPRALDPFLRFAQVLRRAGFAVSPDQTLDFIEGIGILGPRDIRDVYRAGRALFAIPVERKTEYDALFRAVFLGQTTKSPSGVDDDDAVEAYEPTQTSVEIDAPDDQSEVGAEAVTAERLARRNLASPAENAVLERLAREAPSALPRRLSYRRATAKHGNRLDLRRSLRDAAQRDGDVAHLFRTRRKTRQRRLLLLLDVSGSMKNRTEEMMRLAHAVVQAADRAEVFTIGTRLTRVTTALRPAAVGLALARAAEAIADFDGGTRIGEALQTYLAVPRYAIFTRGAAVIFVSDGLERGAPDAMIEAVRKLARSAWRIEWLSPLAADPHYQPKTAGLKALLPFIDRLGDGATSAAVVDHILSMARRA